MSLLNNTSVAITHKSIKKSCFLSFPLATHSRKVMPYKYSYTCSARKCAINDSMREQLCDFRAAIVLWHGLMFCVKHGGGILAAAAAQRPNGCCVLVTALLPLERQRLRYMGRNEQELEPFFGQHNVCVTARLWRWHPLQKPPIQPLPGILSGAVVNFQAKVPWQHTLWQLLVRGHAVFLMHVHICVLNPAEGLVTIWHGAVPKGRSHNNTDGQ